jgi:hypothetical protein
MPRNATAPPERAARPPRASHRILRTSYRVPRTTRRAPACIAVDWSGALSGEKSRIWLAEARAGTLVRLECGRDRPETVRELVASAARDPRLVVGLDFAFSLPRWFLADVGVASARALWDLVAERGEAWLARCAPPFWGRPGALRPEYGPGRPEWRATEGEVVRQQGIGPKSVFQVGGAGSVGTGSLRGMPYLATLQDAGFAIWPFDPPRLPMAVEIYPRYLTGRVNKSSRIARALYIQAHHPRLPRAIQRVCEASEDAFDAAVSALRMSAHARQFLRSPLAPAPDDALEGRIWRPVGDARFGTA